MESVPSPTSDAQAIEMLSGHPYSEEFIEAYRNWRSRCGVVEALKCTGDTFRMLHREENPPQ
jgi:hypothetical protein